MRGEDGTLARGRALPGRGAWLCPDERCRELADRRGAWARALRAPVRGSVPVPVRLERDEPAGPG